VRCAGLRRDGKTAAIASKADQPFFKVIDLETGTSLGKGKHEGITAVALSDDGKYAASASTGGVVVWSLQNSAGPEGVFGVKQTLDYNDRRHVMTEHTFPGDSVANSLAFLPDGQTLAAGNSNRTIWFWNFAGSKAGEAVITVRDAIVGLAFTPDGELGASLDKLHGMLQLAGSPRAIAFGADSKSFHVWMEGGLPLSWNIDIPHMREEACRLAGEQSVDSLCPVQAARRAAAREADRKEADLKQPNRKEGIKR
jgi:WD40 repeat protein